MEERSADRGWPGEGEASARRLALRSLLPLLQEAEGALWRRGDHGDHGAGGPTGLSPSATPDTLHMALLRHGRCVLNIHSYFSNLESRKCCLNLAAAQTTFNNLRLVTKNDDTSDDNDNGSPPTTVPFVDRLSEKDLEVYSQALLCALFPILGVPSPLSDTPDMPVPTPPRVTATRRRRTSRHHKSHDVPCTADPDDMMTSVIPSETLCDVVRQAFGLSRQRAAKYERLVLEPYKKKTHAKVLVEELSNQFSLMENDKHAYYSPQSFLTREAYDAWKHTQRRHLGDLINKFWYSALPSLSSSVHDNTCNHHANYQRLLNKFMTFEASLRGEDCMSVLSGPLSTASIRLLQEFGLRYGVGELSRNAMYLMYLSDHFETEVWFVRHVNSLLVSIMQSLPANRRRVVMVHEEYNMLYKSAMTLHEHCQHTLIKMKSLFPGQQPAEGIGFLIELLTNVLELKAYLLEKHQNPVKDFLINYVKTEVSTLYQRQKMVAVADLKIDMDAVPTPVLLSRLVAGMRDEVADYASNYRHIFLRYFDIVVLSSQCFYIHLMDDVAVLCDDFCDSLSRIKLKPELDLRLLSLAYRLNQLDTDWKDCIPQRYQTWRRALRPVTLRWLAVLLNHCERLTMQTVGADKFTGLELLDVEVKSPVPSRPGSSSAMSLSSLTQSEGSAFDPVTPKGSSVRRSTIENPSLRDWLTDSMQLEASASFTPHDLAVSKHRSDTLNRQQEDMTETSFIQNDSETSFTYRRRPTFLFDEDMQIVNNLEESTETPLNTRDEDDKDADHTDRSTDKGVDDKLNYPPKTAVVVDEQKPSVPQPLVTEASTLDKMHPRTEGTSHSTENREQIQPGLTIPENESNHDQEKNEQISTMTFTSSPPSLQVGGKPVLDENLRTRETTDVHESSQISDHVVKEQNHDLAVLTEDDQNLLTVSLECHAKSFEESFKHDEVNAFLANLDNNQTDASSTPSQSVTKTDIDAKNLPTSAENEPSINFRTSNQPDLDVKKDEESDGAPVIQSPRTSTLSSPTTSVLSSQPSITDSMLSFSGVLSVSGSVIDITTLLQRAISFGQVLAQTVYPLGTESANHDWIALPEDAEKVVDTEVAVRREILDSRRRIYENIIQLMTRVVCLYASSLLCYDLCGTRERQARRLAGDQLVETVKLEHQNRKIWGCRHMAQGNEDCFTYVNRKTRYLADRFEPISEEMGLRMNNIWSLLHILPQLQADVVNAFQLKKMHDLQTDLDATGEDTLLDDFVVLETFPRWKAQSNISTSESSRSLRRRVGSERSDCQRSQNQIRVRRQTVKDDPKSPAATNRSDHLVHGESAQTISSELSETLRSLSSSFGSCSSLRMAPVLDRTEVVFGHCSFHLRHVKDALANILAYRINLFFRRALSLMVAVGLPLVGIEARLHPVTSFLDNQLVALRSWLYKDVYDVVVARLWAHIAQDFEQETEKLISPTNYSNVEPVTLLQTIAFFIKYFHKDGAGVPLHQLTENVTKSMCWLELYTQSTIHLISLHQHLLLHMSERVEGYDGDPLRSARDLLFRMRRELHGEKKCFSGRGFVNWFVNQSSDWLSIHEGADCGVSMEEEEAEEEEEAAALELAQTLLDHGLLRGVEDEEGSLFPCQVPAHPYPSLSLDSYSGRVLPTLSRVETTNSLDSEYSKDKVDPGATSEGHLEDKPMTFSRVASQEDCLSPDKSKIDTDAVNKAGCGEDKGNAGPCNDARFRIDSDTTATSESDMPTPSSNSSLTFQPTTYNFYCFGSVCDGPPLGGVGGTSCASDVSGLFDVTPNQNQLQRAKELYQMCDVTPQLIVQVLSKRRRRDRLAKQFLDRIRVEKDQLAPWEERPTSPGCFGCGL